MTLFILDGCSESTGDLFVTKQKKDRLLDSLQCDEILAEFTEDKGNSFIIKNHAGVFLKITHRRSYPIFVDSLVRTKGNYFTSTRYRYKYQIKPDSVIVTFVRKIVHPSSNWQGQTPGEESLSTVYARHEVKK